MKGDYELTDVQNPFHGAPVYHVEATGSTMTDSEQLLTGKGLPGLLPPERLRSGTVVRADYQTAGRGRLPGRSWEAGVGDSCLFTLILHSDDVRFPPGLFPLLAGLALREALEKEFGIPAAVKWPNDLMVARGECYKKISGILCGKKGEWYLLGMGVNCNQLSFSGGLALQAVSVREISGKKVDIGPFLVSLLYSLKAVFSAAAPFWLNKIDQHLLFRNKTAVIRIGRPPEVETVIARVRGIGPKGELLYSRQGQEAVERLYAGEVSLEQPRPEENSFSH
jgi:BirA family transcriptional regulator, biotin operon repressor / biotin---[acetyl-CoA-carboxylase] ligase